MPSSPYVSEKHKLVLLIGNVYSLGSLSAELGWTSQIKYHMQETSCSEPEKIKVETGKWKWNTRNYKDFYSCRCSISIFLSLIWFLPFLHFAHKWVEWLRGEPCRVTELLESEFRPDAIHGSGLLNKDQSCADASPSAFSYSSGRKCELQLMGCLTWTNVRCVSF